MTVNDNRKNILRIVLITLLSTVVAVGVVLGVIFGLRAAWKRDVTEELSLPAAENGITLKLHEYGVSDGANYSSERQIMYNPSNKGVWFDITNGSSHVFAYGDTAYWSHDSEIEYWQISEYFPASDLEYHLNNITFTEFGLFTDLYDLVLNNLSSVVDGVWKWGDTYYVTLDGDYLIDNNFNGITRETWTGVSAHKYRDFKCTMTVKDGVLKALRISYKRDWKGTQDYFVVRHSENYIELELEQGADFSSFKFPTTFERGLSQLQGNLLKSDTSYADEYAECTYTTPDDAVNIYVHDAGESRNEYASVYAQDGVMTVTTDYGVEIYSLPELKKLRSLEFYAKVAGCDIADGKLAVVVSGKPDTGCGTLNSVIPITSWAYVYDLETFAEICRYDISSVLPGGIDFGLDEVTDAVVYKDGYVYVRFEGQIHVLDLSDGQIGSADSMPSSLKGTDGGGYTFVPYTFDAGESYLYPYPIDFDFPDYGGFSIEGYEVVEFRDGIDYGLFDREKNEFVYIFPCAGMFSSGDNFICSLGDGKYLCHVRYCLFTIDFSELQTHSYEYATLMG